MEEQMFGRLTTLNRLKAVRDDATKSDFVRLQADRSMAKITAQLKDQKLNSYRERLIKATRAGDLHEVSKLENQIRDYEGREIERDE